LHHEDFTGQYGKFFGSYRNVPWYIEDKNEAEELASKLGFTKVSEEKGAVAKKISNFVVGEALCSLCVQLQIVLILL
jgi:hypothetical protein